MGRSRRRSMRTGAVCATAEDDSATAHPRIAAATISSRMSVMFTQAFRVESNGLTAQRSTASGAGANLVKGITRKRRSSVAAFCWAADTLSVSWEAKNYGPLQLAKIHSALPIHLSNENAVNVFSIFIAPRHIEVASSDCEIAAIAARVNEFETPRSII